MTITRPPLPQERTVPSAPESHRPDARIARLGSRLGVAVAVLTSVSFALALTALPDDVPYPFTDDAIRAQWPGDYLWMYPAMVLSVVVVALLAVLHQYAAAQAKVWSLLALVLGTMGSTVLLVDYFLQASIMQVSLEKAQLDGWSMLTQYNPNGVFIALEELGYLLTSIGLLCLVPVFPRAGRAARTLRVLLPTSTTLVVAALVAVSAARGIDRGDVFEIAVITIVWSTLIAAGALIAVVLRDRDPVPGPGSAEQAPQA